MSKEKLSFKSKVFLADTHTIENVVKKVGIQWPSNNIALLQTVYAPTEEANLNGVRLGEDGMAAALPTLIGAQANLNHSADYAPLGFGFIIGIVLDAWLDSNKDINIIFSMAKNVYAEEYQKALNMLADGTLSVSFELMNDPTTTDHLADGTMRLHNYEFTGVGLLLDASPAYPKAKVYEMAKTYKERANSEKELVYASKIVERCDKIIADDLSTETEVFALPSMTCLCPHCNMPMSWDNIMYDADMEMYHRPCISVGPFKKPPFVYAKKNKKQLKTVAKIENLETETEGGQNQMTEEQKKLIADLRVELGDFAKDISDDDLLTETKVAELRNAKAEAEKPAEIVNVEETAKVEEPKVEVSAELSEAQARIQALETENVALKAQVAEFVAKEQAVEDAKKAEKIASTKAELKDNQYAKDFSDEDYLNDVKVKEVRILKENDDLKAEVKALKEAQPAAEVKVTPEAKKIEASTEKKPLESGHSEEVHASVGIGSILRKLGKKD